MKGARGKRNGRGGGAHSKLCLSVTVSLSANHRCCYRGFESASEGERHGGTLPFHQYSSSGALSTLLEVACQRPGLLAGAIDLLLHLMQNHSAMDSRVLDRNISPMCTSLFPRIYRVY